MNPSETKPCENFWTGITEKIVEGQALKNKTAFSYECKRIKEYIFLFPEAIVPDHWCLSLRGLIDIFFKLNDGERLKFVSEIIIARMSL